jgi:hypothetical protein
MRNISDKLQILAFTVFIGFFFAVNLLTPAKPFSPQENRYLAPAPKFSAEALFSGKYTSDFETYVTDQFFGRDGWISLKSFSERAIGKLENNNVFFCKDDTLIERFSSPDTELVNNNITAVNELSAGAGVPVYFALIPGAVKIWEDRLPANANNCDQQELIDDIYSRIDAINVDIYESLSNHSDEYIYYRTDHHWTSLGAYYGYLALGKGMGFEPRSYDSYDPVTVSDDFYGTVYSSSGVRWVAPDSIEMFVRDEGIEVINYNTGKAEAGELYDDSCLQKKDKYAFFLGGISPLIEIKTGRTDAPKLLILRDSYSDCLIPFLTDHFSEICLIDLRYYKYSVSEYISKKGVDAVLVAYSVSNFCSDTSIFMAGK